MYETVEWCDMSDVGVLLRDAIHHEIPQVSIELVQRLIDLVVHLQRVAIRNHNHRNQEAESDMFLS